MKHKKLRTVLITVVVIAALVAAYMIAFMRPQPLLDCLVPRLCVEPLVENAVVHGIEPKAAPGEIRVLVRREGEALLIEVNDDGVGFRAGSESGKRHSHVGLHNIERLVANLYGEGYGLTIESAENRGTRVLLRLPVEEG